MSLPLFSTLSQLVSVLAGLGLVGSLVKPLPPLIDTVGGTVNGLLGPLGLSLAVVPDSLSCTVDLYSPLIPSSLDFPPYDQTLATYYRYRKQQAVNLASWFALESWVVPSMFSCASGNRTSELDFASGNGSPANAKMKLEKHWDTFITEQDFAYLAGLGINTVRLPIGYWSLGPQFLVDTPFEPYASVYTNAWSQVVNAINVAAKYKIGVLVNVVGVPGSQNGKPSSGVNVPEPQLFNSTRNMVATTAVLTYLTQQLASVNNVVGIELMDDPTADPGLESIYTALITTLRNVVSDAADLPFYIHDAYQPDRFSKYLAERQDFVVLDHHSYFVYSPEGSPDMSVNATFGISGDYGQTIQSIAAKSRGNMIIGEYACALPQESLARTSDPNDAMDAFCGAQKQFYQNATTGYAFYTYNKENCTSDAGWCFKAAATQLPSMKIFSSWPELESKSKVDNSKSNNPATVSDALSSVQAPNSDDILAMADTPAANTTNTEVKVLAVVKRHRKQRHYRMHPRAFYGQSTMSSTEKAVIYGYDEGFQTTKSFAAFGMSRLGFVEQYMADSFAKHVESGLIKASKEQYWRDWFYRGVEDAEILIMRAITNNSANN